MAKVWVQICNANPIARRLDLLGPLEAERERYHLARYGCLDRCSVCEKQPYAMINGQLVTAASCEELLAAILQAPALDRSPGRQPAGEGSAELVQ